MSIRRFNLPPNHESRKPIKPTSKHYYKALIFISAISLALIFLIPIFFQSHLPQTSPETEHLTRNTSSLVHLTKNPKPKKTHVLKSTKFDERVKKFINNCPIDALFFMIWISPAPLFSKREILALETLFNSNPHGCLIILSKTLDSPIGKSILRPISNLGFQILPIAPNIPLLFRHTPALKWYRAVKRGEIEPGHVPFAQNLSNLMRLVFLYKYGGVYLDADFIVLRNFSGLRNSIGAQSMNSETGDWSRLNNAVLVFEKSHPLVMRFIKEFVARFNGDKWGHNGPYLVSRVIERVRVAEKRKKVMRKKMNEKGLSVYNFTVLPPEAFYPMDWNRIYGLFERPKTTAQMRWAKGKLAQLVSGRTYGVHLWHKHTRGMKIEKGSIMADLISQHCLSCQEICTS